METGGTTAASVPRLAPRSAAWSDLGKRALSAAILIPAALACIWLGSLPWTTMVALAVGGLAMEWVHLCGRRVRDIPGMIVPVAVLAAGAAAVIWHSALGLLLLAVASGLTFALGQRLDRNRAGLLAAGVIYVGLAGVALIWLRHDGGAGRANVLFVILVVWASDIGAYVTGRLFGGPKLAPRVSPSKTWAGAAGGLAFAMLAGLATAAALDRVGLGAALRALLLGGLIGLAAQAGDLLESFIKRRVGVKDSGRLIPGHGGLLDRLDGVLTAAPAAALLALELGRGVLLWR